ncbi:MAG TPA: type II toxin-antitoxin system VapC family toxin [Verrucomicrobiae bacterium]|nr:type II toxin-antitoxin system VapC family toxin [Verrucomicrobiae bacterium]
MESVYIETSVVSYLVARTKENTLAREWQKLTADWWRLRRPRFECVTSPEVLKEAAVGDAEMSRKRLDQLNGLTVLQHTNEVDVMAERFLNAGALPKKAKADAVHLAFATVYKINYLLTWNMKHLANAMIWIKLRPVAEQHGYEFPFVGNPLQLMGRIEYEG